MRSHGSAALVVVAGALVISPSAAVAAGATTARGGGAGYGSALPRLDRRPIATRLTVSPRETVAGRALPQISFRLRQRGSARVQARVVVLRLPGSRPVARVKLGWVKPGTRVSVPLPAGLQLRSGRYVVRLHAKDHRGHALARDARHPGRARLVVHRAPVAAGPVPPAATTAAVAVVAWPAPAPSPGGPGVFPVGGAFTFGTPDGRFGAGRTGHIHEGQDIPAAAGVPVVAPYAGVVSSVSYQAGAAGEYVVLDAVDGRDYFFAHCVRNSTTVAAGTAVAAGQQLCQVGTTGDSRGPHLHFEIWNGGWRVAGGYPIDPLPELRAWSGV